ncbi:MAG TPA: SA1362 family protein [Bacillaceae bacterium]|nr:SA1362 family protein [Paenibacillus bovis]HLU22203.1 SA1362 family protein [Bacillaceae bacterium]
MNIRNWIVGVVAILALTGLASTLIRNPSSLLKQLLMMVVITALIIVIYKVWMRRKPNSKDSIAYAKAVKLSKKRKRQANKTVISSSRKRPLRKKSTAHLTVIEGKKNKKKDRAIF